MPDPIVYLNGEFVPYDQATIGVEDRSVQFGDGIYEVIRWYGGKPFKLESHLARLVRFLCTEGDWITGAQLNINGGQYM